MSQEVQASEQAAEKPLPNTGTFVDFEIKREGWNLYKIEDGTLLRARVILAGIQMEKELEDVVKQLRPGQKLKLGFRVNPRTIFGVESPPELKGEPDFKTHTNAELKSSITNADMDFETMRAVWNLYELENGATLKARLSVVTVNKTSKFDSMGVPVYFVDSNIDIKFELPDHLRKIIEEKRKRLKK